MRRCLLAGALHCRWQLDWWGCQSSGAQEISMTTDDQFSAMLIVDVFVANLWMPFCS